MFCLDIVLNEVANSLIPPKLFISVICCDNKFHRFSSSHTWKVFPCCLCYLCFVTLISFFCMIDCQIFGAGFLKRRLLLWAKMITFFIVPPIFMGFCLQSKHPRRRLQGPHSLYILGSKCVVHLHWEMGHTHTPPPKHEVEKPKYRAEFDGTVEVRVTGWISSAQVYWEAWQSHSGLQGSV